MKTQLIAVGEKMPAWIKTGYEDYAKRLPRELKPKLVELPLAPRAKNQSVEKARQLEGEAIAAVMPERSIRVVLDVEGRMFSTEKLADKLAVWQASGNDICFVIGGPDGLAGAVLDAATERWSLSPLTLPHPLVRVVFIEQWYRAWSILQHHPYHK